jgi:hypothetical protein
MANVPMSRSPFKFITNFVKESSTGTDHEPD